MITRLKDIQPTSTEHARGGNGTMLGYELADASQLKGKAKMFKLLELEPGSSIGPHSHIDDFEIYFILDGEGVVDEGNGPVPVSCGDTIYTADGQAHSIACAGSQTLRFIACVIDA